MVNINLTADLSECYEDNSFKKGLSWIAALLIVAILVYGGLWFYQNSLSHQISAVKTSQQDELAKMNSPQNKAVINFQNRVAVAKTLVSDPHSVADNFSILQSVIIPAAYVENYSFDKPTHIISLDLVGADFNAVAQQIYSFKKGVYAGGASYFSSVVPGKALLNDKGKVNFSVSLTLNPQSN